MTILGALNPVRGDGKPVVLVLGQDHAIALGNQIEFVPGSGTWPDGIDSATWRVYGLEDTETLLELDAAYVGNDAIGFELPADDLAAANLAIGTCGYRADLVAVVDSDTGILRQDLVSVLESGEPL